MRALLLLFSLAVACDGAESREVDDGHDDDDELQALACTPDAQGVIGTELAFEQLPLLTPAPETCDGVVLASPADLAAAFPAGDASPEVMAVDLEVDRIVLTQSNPVVRFVVDVGDELVIVEEPICQGAAPHCVAYLVRDTAHGSATSSACPYTGPACLAP